MRRTAKTDSRKDRSVRPFSYRPTVELLEDRLPPGDVLLGSGLVGSWLGERMAVLSADSLRAISRQAEPRFGHDLGAQLSTFVNPAANRSGSAVLFAANLFPSQA